MKPILVTGSHRSGTTWVGSMLALSPAVGYINEPLKLKYRPGVFNKRLSYWFTYITEENQADHFPPLRDLLKFRYHLVEQLKRVKNPSQLRHAFKSYIKWTIYRLSNIVSVIKDPVAIFSEEWLAKTFNMNVVVMIRHPAVFASSLKRYYHSFPFSHLLEQPLLMRDHLKPFGDEIGYFARQEQDIIDQATLLWRCIYSTVNKYRMVHNDWFFLRHEDISEDPRRCLRDLFRSLGLVLSEKISSNIEAFSGLSNPCEIPESASHHWVKLNSKASIKNWKRRLTKREIHRIRRQVEDVSKEFYSQSDW